MKRGTDEIRYLILKLLDKKGKTNIEGLRKSVNTSFQTILTNTKFLNVLGYLKMFETDVGKRKYREMEITPEGKKFLKKLEKVFEK